MAHELAIQFPDREVAGSYLTNGFASGCQLIGTSPALKQVLDQLEHVAPTNATVLLLGETGTGKELAARAIHQRSLRRQRNFVVVNAGALPPSLIENELFGRDRGAYTGAHASQAGRFELANGGTVFLDEIGELPLELQPRLLRVLQEGEVERLGSAKTVRVDARVVAATNRNLPEEVRQSRFRRDLFYRLNVFPITLPPLRDRREDLPALVHYLSDRLGRRLGRPITRITAGTLPALERYDWPGNIRELENVLQQAIILSHDGVLDLADYIGQSNDLDQAALVGYGLRSLVDVERNYIRQVLDHAQWRIEGRAGAADVLGLRPSTLRTRMQKLGLARITQQMSKSAS